MLKNNASDKFRDHCDLTGKYRSAAHSICNINVIQKQSSFIPFIFRNFSDYDCYMFLKKLVDKKNGKLKFDINPEQTKNTFL